MLLRYLFEKIASKINWDETSEKYLGTFICLTLSSATIMVVLLLSSTYGLVKDPIYQTYQLIIIPSIIAISELIFLFDPQKPTSLQSKFWFTALVKLESYADVAFLLSILTTVKLGVDHWSIVGLYGVYILVFLGVVGLVAVYVWLNSLKYHKIYKKETFTEQKIIQKTDKNKMENTHK
jgi:hypothetical protein